MRRGLRSSHNAKLCKKKKKREEGEYFWTAMKRILTRDEGSLTNLGLLLTFNHKKRIRGIKSCANYLSWVYPEHSWFPSFLCLLQDKWLWGPSKGQMFRIGSKNPIHPLFFFFTLNFPQIYRALAVRNNLNLGYGTVGVSGAGNRRVILGFSLTALSWYRGFCSRNLCAKMLTLIGILWIKLETRNLGRDD